MAQAMPANRERTGRPEPPVEHRFKPGQSGNPNGRPRGIARQMREAIGDQPERLTGLLLDIANDPDTKPADRIAAVREYLDRAYGKAPTYTPVEGGDPLDRDETERAVDAIVDELASRRETPAAGEAPSRTVAGQSPAGAAPA